MDSTRQDRFRKAFVLIAALSISALFLVMIRDFLMALLMAGIASGLSQPLYRRLLDKLGGREGLAATLTILIVIVLVVGPLMALVGVVASQALEVSQTVGPWIDGQIDKAREPGVLDEWLGKIPLYDQIEPYQTQILEKAGEMAGAMGTFLFNALSGTARGTVNFFLNLFIMLYAMFFFLMGGGSIVDRILDYTPLSDQETERMLDKFVSVTRATLKGTIVIGAIQGALAGLAFWVAGIGGAVFWGTIMAVLSVIPGIGAALIWVPAAIYLLVSGQTAAALGLTAWCALVVGTVDNVLRPRLVGSDTQMPDLLILIGTLGGIFMFGAVGFIIGPIVAALFLTIWDIYGTTFKDLLVSPPPEEIPVEAEAPSAE